MQSFARKRLETKAGEGAERGRKTAVLNYSQNCIRFNDVFVGSVKKTKKAVPAVFFTCEMEWGGL